MLKLLLGNGFVVRKLLAAATGGLSLLLGQDAAGHVAELLMDPEVIKQIFNVAGSALILYAGFSRKDVAETKATLDRVEDIVLDYLPKTEIDPYPGWDYDPLRGWVKNDASA